MPHLIKLLLKKERDILVRLHNGNKPTPNKNNIDVNQLAVEIFNQAINETRKKSRQRTWLETFNFEKSLQEKLGIYLTKHLLTVDLLDDTKYQNVWIAIEDWYPKHSEQYKCDRVKKLLLKLLPAARQKQQLLAVCVQYKNYLKPKIEKELIDQFPKEYQVYCRPHLELSINTSRSYQNRAVEAKDMDFFATHYHRRLAFEQDSSLPSAMEKYRVVSALQITLQTDKPAPKQIAEFSQVFKSNHSKIEKRRDSTEMLFIKLFMTVLSGGVAVLAGLWSVKGAEIADKVKNILDPSTIRSLP